MSGSMSCMPLHLLLPMCLAVRGACTIWRQFLEPRWDLRLITKCLRGSATSCPPAYFGCHNNWRDLSSHRSCQLPV
ncbi:hypothetical protein HD554DRAFT_2059774 [Boletus coccyginus]|nr:hypothetical protein HD554DRAFT_2059774 [Boletus coccyginus]